MRILYITPWFPANLHSQDGSYIYDSIKAIKDQGHEVCVLFVQPWKLKKAIKLTEFHDAFRVHTCRFVSIPRFYFRAFSNWSYLKRITPIVKTMALKYNCELIHAHTEFYATAAVKAGNSLNIPTVVSLHGVETNARYWTGIGKMIKRYLSDASRLVLVGESIAPFFSQKTYRNDHFRVVHNGFRLYPDTIAFQKPAWSKHTHLISVSNLQATKGVDITIHALAHLKKLNIHNWTYTIVGEGTERQKLEKLVIELSLTQQVHFVGACSHDEVYQHLKTADIFCLPSYCEAFGIAYIEAMAYGLLAIGVEGEGPQAFIKHQKTGLLVKPQDSGDLVKILRTMFQQPEKMQIIAEQGRRHVLERFTWQQHADNLIKVYQEVLL